MILDILIDYKEYHYGYVDRLDSKMAKCYNVQSSFIAEDWSNEWIWKIKTHVTYVSYSVCAQKIKISEAR